MSASVPPSPRPNPDEELEREPSVPVPQENGRDKDVSEEEAARLRRRREALQSRIEIALLEQQLETLRRRDNAGYTPVGSASTEDGDQMSITTGARSATTGRRGPSSRPRLREPETFKGKTLKEARDFIRSLELVFALAPEAYPIETEKVLYGVIFLAGEPRETWHQNNPVSQAEVYSWADFNAFVLNVVEDPVNRSLSTTVAYESARQGENQTV